MAGGGWADGTLVGFDLETTGLDRERDEPVSYGFSTFCRGELVEVHEGHIVPTVPISAGAQRVHGLSTARLAALGAVAHEAGMATIAERLCALSAQGTPIVGANLAYDLTIVDRALSRLASPSGLAAAGWHGPALDVLVIDRALDRDFAARPVRRLDALCEHYGVRAAMHTAAGDATAAVRILLAQVARFDALATSTLAELQADQAAWHRAWCDEFSARRVAQGRAPLDASESAWPYLELLAPTLF